jgi:ParB family chromosome partitioning protein
LARVPLEQQVARWQAAQDRKDDDAEGNGNADKRPPSASRVIASALKDFDSKPHLLADALRSQLGPDGVKTLLAALAGEAVAV